MDKEALIQDYSKYFSCLTEREEKIIKWRYPLKGEKRKTLAEIGFFLGITRERVRQIEAVALRKMRNAIMEDEKSSNKK